MAGVCITLDGIPTNFNMPPVFGAIGVEVRKPPPTFTLPTYSLLLCIGIDIPSGYSCVS
jgi:hypothetical protein